MQQASGARPCNASLHCEQVLPGQYLVVSQVRTSAWPGNLQRTDHFEALIVPHMMRHTVSLAAVTRSLAAGDVRGPPGVTPARGHG